MGWMMTWTMAWSMGDRVDDGAGTGWTIERWVAVRNYNVSSRERASDTGCRPLQYNHRSSGCERQTKTHVLGSVWSEWSAKNDETHTVDNAESLRTHKGIHCC